MTPLLADHLPLVRRVAGRIARRLPRHVQLDDLISAGTEGLVDAAQRFDPEKGVAFSAYAEIRIRGAVMDELRGHDFVPRSVRGRRRAYEQARAQAQRAGTSTTDEAIARRLGLSPGELSGWLDETQLKLVSADDLDGDELHDGAAGADERLASQQRLGQLRSAVRTLSERLQLVLALYYVEELTLKEIGATLGVTESRVCQLHGQAVSKIRAALAEEEGFAQAA